MRAIQPTVTRRPWTSGFGAWLLLAITCVPVLVAAPVSRAATSCERVDSELRLSGSGSLAISRDADGNILVDGADPPPPCGPTELDDVSAIRVEMQGDLTLDLGNGGFVRSDGSVVPLQLDLSGTDDALNLTGDTGDDHLSVGGEAIDLTGDGAPDLFGAGSIELLRVSGGSGNDEISLRGGDDLGPAWSSGSYLDGGTGDDTLVGGAGDDYLVGGAGDDDLQGREGADRFDMTGDPDGQDSLNGGSSTDVVDYAHRTGSLRLYANRFDASGEPGEGDSLIGVEVLVGGAGDDLLVGTGMNELLIGNAGDDVIRGGAGLDRLNGGIGVDRLLGEREADEVLGGPGRDVLRGGDGADVLRGGDGADVLEGGPGKDRLLGGAGRDVATFANAASRVEVDLSRDVASGASSGTDRVRSIEDVRGSPFGDTLVGNGSANHLYGGRGEDSLAGRAGNDLLDGGRGIDRGDGGPGTDRCRSVERAVSCDVGRVAFFMGQPDGLIAPRTIDPTLSWNSFLGGAGEDYVGAVIHEPLGGAYIVGTSTAAWGSPVRGFRGGGSDAFVARVDAGGALLWNTFLGGKGQDVGLDVVLGPDGTILVTGWSGAAWGDPIRAYRGRTDGFVAWVDPRGSLLKLTFVGGRGQDRAVALASGSDDGLVLVASTSSRSWGSPLRPFSGGTDIAIAELRRDGRVRWNTFLGGPADDVSWSIASSGAGFIVGGASSGSFGSPLHPFSGGASDAIVAAFDPAGDLRWFTFLGGSGSDESRAVSLDPQTGEVVIGGRSTRSWGNPLRAFQGRSDGFVASLSADGARRWSTFLGGSGWDAISATAVDPAGHLFVIGQSSASWGKPRRSHSGGEDAFLAYLSAEGALRWSTFLGGRGTDAGADLTFPREAVLAAGTSDTDWGDPLRAFKGGWTDAFLASVPARATDLMVARRLKGPYVGRDTYNTTGEDQTIRVSARRGETVTFYVRGRNEGIFPDRIRFQGCSSSTGFGVRYYRGSTEITAAVTSGSFTSPLLDPGERVTLRLTVLVKRLAKVGDTKTCRVTGYSQAAVRAQDTIRVAVTVSKR
jgi:Ca2+-binding RTX toxin-like protein